tara:strand:+ start:5174 stop:6241 length:1068 start_codon:yes stop_codon:yes gene_type:complete
MSEEQTNLVEEATAVATTTEESSNDDSNETPEVSAFDPKAFASEQPLEEFQGKYNEEAAEKFEKSQEPEEPVSDSEESEDGFAWDNIEVEQKEEEQVAEEVEEDWDSPVQAESSEEVAEGEESREPVDLDWSKFAKELGVEGTSKEDIIQALNSPFIEQPKNDVIDKLNEYLSYSDRELVSAEMKTDGMDEFEIEEAIDKMEDSGVLKREAYRIKRQLNSAMEQQKEKFYKDKQQEQMSAKDKVDKNKKELQGHLKSLGTFMGGTVTKNQAQDAYKYITSGKMADDIWNSHDNASEVAMFMLFKDKFAKILRSQGLEDGKASILNDITSPSLSSKGTVKTSLKKSGFDPSAFMRE